MSLNPIQNLNGSNRFKFFQTDRLKKYLPMIGKIEIKYSFEGFEEENNFLHRNFFRFEIYFELNFLENQSLI
jgi:hypothetical protein